MSPVWRVWVDVGGTFTDAVATSPGGEVLRAKVLSTGSVRARVERSGPERLVLERPLPGDPAALPGMRVAWDGGTALVESADAGSLGLAGRDRPSAGAVVEVSSDEPAPLLASRLLTGVAPGKRLPAVEMRLATTRGTNTLLQRNGAPTALFVTEGHGDILRIGTQQRPEIFARRVVPPPQVPRWTVEVPERTGAGGEEVRPLDLAPVLEAAGRVQAEGAEAAAVCLLHSPAAPGNELAVVDALAKAGFRTVVASHLVAPLTGALARARTAVVEAHLGPVVSDYLEKVAGALGEGGGLLVMTSAGELTDMARHRAAAGLLSGPAGGVVGAGRAAAAHGMPRAVSFDMGGTSTDAARWEETPDHCYEHEVGGIGVALPGLAIESVAAGGGTVCEVRDGLPAVGPESAGADPGPACYGRGGPLTLTDCNLVLGHLDPEEFGIPIDLDRAREALAAVAAALPGAAGPEEAAGGFIEVADERMANAIRSVSEARGHDPADHTLVAFGGAGGLHAAGVAERLGISEVLFPADAGLLSAWGLGAAAVAARKSRRVERPLAEVEDRLAGLASELEAEALDALGGKGVAETVAAMRLAGQESTVEVPLAEDVGAAFAEAYASLYGVGPGGREAEVVALHSSARVPTGPPDQPSRTGPSAMPPGATRRAWSGGGWVEAMAWRRADLSAGGTAEGPALVMGESDALLVPAGWGMEVAGDGAIRLRLRSPSRSRGRPEEVETALFSARFQAVAEEMGERLRRTAFSVNVKERLDFSCGLLDPDGRLVANAPHIPVHLGALGLCVREIDSALAPGEGDVAVTNHPAFGGSHLPDVTVAAPVHHGGERVGWVAARAHHAEIGGARPGSMPPRAGTLAEEGVVIPPTLLVEAGEARWERVLSLLRSGPHPSRDPDRNLVDMEAAVAAAAAGTEALLTLCRESGSSEVLGRMRALSRRSRALARTALAGLGDGLLVAEERLDDGTPLRVAIDLRGGKPRLDFAGSGGVHPGNLNAPPAVCRAAVLYALRLLVDRPLPLNEGLADAVELDIPDGILSPPFTGDSARDPAVAAGNVETSQRLVDTLLKAMGLLAGGQGTMNNVLFGDEEGGHYETVGGGAGAGPGFAGASGVHVHMSNTRITDAEVLERRLPVRVERFALRRGSGGVGRWSGGDGLFRAVRFLAPMDLSLLGQHRVEAPYGMAGGDPGAVGAQRIVRAGGEVETLPGVAEARMEPGDLLELETPGGGGWGVR